MGQHLEDRGHAVHRSEFVDGAFVSGPQHLLGDFVGGGVARCHEFTRPFEAVAVVVEEFFGPRLDAWGDRAVGGQHRCVWEVEEELQ